MKKLVYLSLVSALVTTLGQTEGMYQNIPPQLGLNTISGSRLPVLPGYLDQPPPDYGQMPQTSEPSDTGWNRVHYSLWNAEFGAGKAVELYGDFSSIKVTKKSSKKQPDRFDECIKNFKNTKSRAIKISKQINAAQFRSIGNEIKGNKNIRALAFQGNIFTQWPKDNTICNFFENLKDTSVELLDLRGSSIFLPQSICDGLNSLRDSRKSIKVLLTNDEKCHLWTNDELKTYFTTSFGEPCPRSEFATQGTVTTWLKWNSDWIITDPILADKELARYVDEPKASFPPLPRGASSWCGFFSVQPQPQVNPQNMASQKFPQVSSSQQAFVSQPHGQFGNMQFPLGNNWMQNQQQMNRGVSQPPKVIPQPPRFMPHPPKVIPQPSQQAKEQGIN